VAHDGEKLRTVPPLEAPLVLREPSEFEVGFFLGVLVGEGHFGGDGRTAQITLRMHTRHESLFRWILAVFGGKLYGPYEHGGRSYFQWMARGPVLRDAILPLLARHWPHLDEHVRSRIQAMCGRYSIPLEPAGGFEGRS
jgi:hypothetical protein